MNNIYYTKTPFDAVLKIEDDGEYIKRISLQEHACGGCLNAMPSPLGYRLKKQLKEYFEGERIVFDIPVHPDILNGAEKVTEIPYGEYDGSISLEDNPILILIPSHRCAVDTANESEKALLDALREHEKMTAGSDA